jgi:hypothetical protein
VVPEAERFQLFRFIRCLADVVAMPPQSELVLRGIDEKIKQF